jgi:hypothetical protein
METSLHRSLKERYAATGSRRLEVKVGGFRIDAVDEAGRLIEIQSGPLGPLRGKLSRLLPHHRIRIIKPVALAKRVVLRSRRDGPDLSVRRSPKRASLYDVFDDMVGIVRVFPHSNLAIDILAVTVDEVRVLRRRRRGYIVADRRLGAILGTTSLVLAGDLWALLPEACAGLDNFTTSELAACLGRPLWFAQRVAYCLRLTGAARVVGKSRNHLVYVRHE